MTEEMTPSSQQPSNQARDKEAEQTAFIHSTMDKFLSAADVERVYGAPIQHGDYMVIPTAEIVGGMGFGVGSGGASGEQGNGSGSGGGGGGNVFSRPVAVVVAGPQGVEVQPVFDITKIALTGITAFGFMIATVRSFRRGPRG